MPRNGSGNYSLPQPAFVPGTVISSSAVNSDFSDIATALTGSIAADGQTPLTGPLKGVSGTVVAPSWTFASDTASGLFLLAAGSVGLVAENNGFLVSSNGFGASSAAVQSAGSGYAVNDTITLTGGTVLRNTVLKVATLSGSGVASVTVLDAGLYSTNPSNPVAQGSTSGVGSGATFNITWTADNFMSAYDGSTITTLWNDLGASTYMAGAMASVNGAALAVYIGAANIAAAVSTALPIPAPEGRLTLTSNTPVLITDTTGQGTIYWTPYTGLWTPIHNGQTIIPYQLAGELAFIMSSSQAANQIYDIFLAYNAGSPVIGAGPTWGAGTGGNVTAGTCARGTGANGTSLTKLNGITVNAVSLTLAYNNGTTSGNLTVAANQGIYLGTVFIDATAGQTTCHFSFNQNRKFGLWNAYNRVPIVLKAGDSTANWVGSGVSIHAQNNVPASWNSNEYNQGSGTACNGLIVLQGLAEEPIKLEFIERISFTVGGTATGGGEIGIGLNSVSVTSGTIGFFDGAAVSSTLSGLSSPLAQFLSPPLLGINTFTALELPLGSGCTFFGTEANAVLSGQWRG
jgi:hypothetical protein